MVETNFCPTLLGVERKKGGMGPAELLQGSQRTAGPRPGPLKDGRVFSSQEAAEPLCGFLSWFRCRMMLSRPWKGRRTKVWSQAPLTKKRGSSVYLERSLRPCEGFEEVIRQS